MRRECTALVVVVVATIYSSIANQRSGTVARIPASGAPTAQGPAVPESGRLLFGEKMDLNRATAEDLEAIPGIGPKRAVGILEERNVRGRFETIDDLLEVPGIGPATLTEIRPYVAIEP